MKWAQITLIVWWLAVLLMNANQHLKPRSGVNNFFAALLVVTLEIMLIYFAGGLNKVLP